MKSAHVVDETAAFPNPDRLPTDPDLKSALGPAFPAVGEILAQLRMDCPAATAAWQFSAKVGWYRIALLKKRRLFYLVPQHRNFRLTVILGRKAIDSLQTSIHAARIASLLVTAPRYPEGTAFTFDRTSCDAGLVRLLLQAKLAP